MKQEYIDNKIVLLMGTPSDILITNDVVKENLKITLDIMNNCIDTIYDLVKISYPSVYRSTLYLSSDERINAYADNNKRIIVNLGLISAAIPLINRYQNDILTKYNILKGKEAKEVQSGIRVHLWRFVVLHELYHLWNGHIQWKAKYQVDEKENIIINPSLSTNPFSLILSEAAEQQISQTLSKEKMEANITQQALELDADSSAVSMLINLLFYDMENRKIEKHLQKDYIKENLAYIMAAISSTFWLFDGNAGCKFELLDTLECRTHPIPAIRFIYAEEIANEMLFNYIKDEKEIMYLESEWQKIVCDVEADYKGIVDMGQVFFYPAYTEIAQKHLRRIKRRLTDMYDTLQEFVLSNRAPKLSEDDIAFDGSAVWFDKKGNSLRDWTNPATGKKVAKRSDKMPIIVGKKIGRNDPCPCGSGLKYKRCCGK